MAQTEAELAGSTGKGAIAGAKKGALIGSIVPIAGTAIGAVAGGIAGGVTSHQKGQKAREAEGIVGAQDPQELARLAEIDRIRKSIGAGTDAATQESLRNIRQTGAATQEKIARSTGGDIGATIAGLTRAQKGTNTATNQAIISGQSRVPFFENLRQQLGTRISQRALEIGLQRRDQALAEDAQRQKDVNADLGGALAYGANAANGSGVNTFGGAVGSPQGGGGSFVANQPNVDPSSLAQTGTPATSGYVEPGQVNIPTQSSLSTGDMPGLQNMPIQNGPASTQIADQSLNSPVQQVPTVNPLSQGQYYLEQLAKQIQSNPNGIPTDRQNELGNLVSQFNQ